MWWVGCHLLINEDWKQKTKGDDLAEHLAVMKPTTKNNSFWVIIKMHCMQIDILQKQSQTKGGNNTLRGNNLQAMCLSASRIELQLQFFLMATVAVLTSPVGPY